MKKKDGMCDFYRIEILNYSFFLYKMLKSKDSYFQTRNLSDVEIALSIEAIVYIQRQLRNTDIYKYIV